MSRYVYFMQSPSGGPIKIGLSCEPQNRLNAIRCSNPTPISLLGVIPDGGLQKEREVHKEFAGDRLHGEWFRPSVALQFYIESNAVGYKKVARPKQRYDEVASDMKLLGIYEVCDKVGLSRSTVLNRVKEGTFPKSRKSGPRRVAWVESEIDEWIEALPTKVNEGAS